MGRPFYPTSAPAQRPASGLAQTSIEEHPIYIPDYTQTGTNVPGSVGIAAGWLPDRGAAGVDYATGDVAPDFVAQLSALCEDLETRVAQTRGFHTCTLCPTPSEGFRHQSSSELWIYAVVDGVDVVFQMPRLVAHYVAAHGYLPPRELVDAVTTHGINAVAGLDRPRP